MTNSQPRRTASLAALLAAASTFTFFAPAAEAQVSAVYREVFGNSTAGNTTFTSVGWTAYSGASNLSADTTNAPVSNSAGRVQNLGNLGQSQVETSQTNGFGVFGSGAANLNNFAYTTEYNGAPISFSSLDSISLYQSTNVTSGVGFRAAIQIGSTWYVTNAQTSTLSTTAANFGTQAAQLTFSGLSSASWSTLDFTPGSTLSVGSTATGLSGNITGFGVFIAKAATSNIVRFDTFEVTASAIPEPSSVGVVAGLGAVGLVAARRRRRD